MEGLLDEIRLEMSRISERNLGRDNRIVADSGVAPRFPYLDEEVVRWVCCGLQMAFEVIDNLNFP